VTAEAIEARALTSDIEMALAQAVFTIEPLN
jgi:hypothetical protein